MPSLANAIQSSKKQAPSVHHSLYTEAKETIEKWWKKRPDYRMKAQCYDGHLHFVLSNVLSYPISDIQKSEVANLVKELCKDHNLGAVVTRDDGKFLHWKFSPAV